MSSRAIVFNDVEFEGELLSTALVPDDDSIFELFLFKVDSGGYFFAEVKYIKDGCDDLGEDTFEKSIDSFFVNSIEELFLSLEHIQYDLIIHDLLSKSRIFESFGIVTKTNNKVISNKKMPIHETVAIYSFGNKMFCAKFVECETARDRSYYFENGLDFEIGIFEKLEEVHEFFGNHDLAPELYETVF